MAAAKEHRSAARLNHLTSEEVRTNSSINGLTRATSERQHMAPAWISSALFIQASGILLISPLTSVVFAADVQSPGFCTTGKTSLTERM